MTRVSVCMTSYNGEKFIAEQISSILNQLSDDDELIISDDGSKDSTKEIVKSFQDKRIVFLEDNSFRNVVLNFEHCLKKAQGEYIFLSDQDDIWHANKVDECLKLLKTYDLIVSDAKIINHNNEVIEESLFEVLNSGPGFIKNLQKNTFVGACMCFNKKILNKALPFPKKIPMHDSWIGLLASRKAKVYFYNNSLVSYRRHEDNLSSSPMESSDNSIFNKLGFRLRLLSALSTRKFK